MEDTNTAPTPLDNCQVLSKADGPTTNDIETLKVMGTIPYQEAIRLLLYAAICTQPDITFPCKLSHSSHRILAQSTGQPSSTLSDTLRALSILESHLEAQILTPPG